MSKLTNTAYLVLRPDISAHGTVRGFKAVRATQTQPRILSDYEVFIEVDIAVPTNVFDARVRAHIDVPETAARTLADVEVRDDEPL